VDLDALLLALGGMGVASAVVEGGAGLITGFLRARLVTASRSA
jgi:riboflavin biosynthesis pyrimidine reductase